jgi:hypothetical protein
VSKSKVEHIALRKTITGWEFWDGTKALCNALSRYYVIPKDVKKIYIAATKVKPKSGVYFEYCPLYGSLYLRGTARAESVPVLYTVGFALERKFNLRASQKVYGWIEY